MNKTKGLIINYIIKMPAGKKISLKEIAVKLELSERMVRIYWREMEDFFKEYKFDSLFFLKNGMVTFQGNERDINRLYSCFLQLDFYRYRLVPEERRLLVQLYLLSKVNLVKVRELEELFCVSKATMMQDLSDLKNRQTEIWMDFDKNRHAGLRLNCSLEQRCERLFILLEHLDLLRTYPWNQAECYVYVYIGFVERIFQIRKYRLETEVLLKYAESESGYILSDADYFQLVFMLCILKNLLEKEEQHKKNEKITLQVSDIPGKAGKFINIILQDLILQEPSRENICYVRQKLCELLEEFRNHNSNRRIKCQVLVSNFLSRIAETFGSYLLEDIQLKESLVEHFLRMEKKPAEESNPFIDQLKKIYNQNFQEVKHAVTVVEHGLGHKLSDDDLGYVLMHILVAQERYEQQLPRANVVIVCNSGMGTSQYLALKLKKSFPIHVVEITSTHLLGNVLQNRKCDLVISTVPLLENPDVEWIQIGFALNEKEASELKNKITLICSKHIMSEDITEESETKEKYTMPLVRKKGFFFSDLLSSSRVLLEAKAENWRTAIRLAGSLLMDEEKAEDRYTEAMVQAVEDFGPYIVFTSGIALAHARPVDGVLESAAAVIRLKKPVCFYSEKNDPVEFVLAVGISEEDMEKGYLTHIMMVLCQDDTKEALREAVSAEEFCRNLKTAELKFEHKNLSL